MSELRRRLREVVETEYGGSAREASLALGSNPNLLGGIFKNTNQVPELETLAAMADTYHWTLPDVVYWALDRPGPPVEIPPLAEVERGLMRLGLPAEQRQILRDLATALVGVTPPRSP